MDDVAAYYLSTAPATHYPYYQPPSAPLHGLYTSPRDEVRTLFVAGLPEDVCSREIYNLFREFPGYESSHLRSPNQSPQPFAFAVFMDQQSGIAAMHALNGMVFDLEKGSTLYIDLAKSNSRSKRQRAGPKRELKGLNFQSLHPVMHMQRNNAPCPTLFVANLGPTCTEHELIQVFSRCPGFIKLKMQGTFGAPVAFVDFQDTAYSTGALSHLQGTILYSSIGEGMQLEYAKSRMGMRKR